MNAVLMFALLILVLMMMTTSEGFTEMFGFSGHTKPIGNIKLDDPRPLLTGYNEAEAVLDNDMMEKFVLTANKEIMRRTGVSTYIIETIKVKRYTGPENEIYECMFMVMKKGGFSFGFSIVASFEVKNGKVRIMSLRTQPIDAEAPSDVSAFEDTGSEGRAFLDYNLVKVSTMPNQSEFQAVKNKLM